MTLEADILNLQARVLALEALPKAGTWIWLAAALTSTSYDGNDTVAVGTVTIDTSTVFGAPAGILAAYVHVQGNWAATAAASLLSLEPTGVTVPAIKIRAHDTVTQEASGFVPCDANGDFDMRVVTADALNVALRIYGYLKL